MSALPNIITVLRIMLVGPLVWFLSQARYQEAMVIFIVAGLSDALDGLLARHYRWTSQLGAALDPMADKLMVFALIVMLAWLDHIPIWLALVIVGRDFVILGGAFVYRMWFRDIKYNPTMISKINTVVQIVTLASLLVALAYPQLFGGYLIQIIDPYMFWVLLVLALVSGADYVWSWGRKAYLRKQGLEGA